jgi:uncharacterized membrane protein
LYLSKTNSELKTDAKAQLKGKWGMAILAFIIYNVVAGLPSAIPYVGFVISIVISGPMALGFMGFYLNVKRGGETALESLFDGFKNFLPAFLTQLLIGIFTFLWSLLLIIPGIIKSISYSQALFILFDNPEMRALDAITLSRKMMDGYKGKYFILQLSFIGWGLLCLLTLGIGFLWLAPYVVTSSANFYDDVKAAYEGRQNLYD